MLFLFSSGHSTPAGPVGSPSARRPGPAPSSLRYCISYTIVTPCCVPLRNLSPRMDRRSTGSRWHVVGRRDCTCLTARSRPLTVRFLSVQKRCSCPAEHFAVRDSDVGFLSWPAQYELAINPSNQTALNAVKSMALHLGARYSSVVGCTRSWDTAATDFDVVRHRSPSVACSADHADSVRLRFARRSRSWTSAACDN